MCDDEVDQVRRLERALRAGPQVELRTDHVLHAGMYSRTVRIPAGVVLTGALIKVATVLIVSGDATVFIGDDSVRLQGYHVLPASAGRKQAFIAHAETALTMSFPTRARTVEEAEAEFTDETDLLLSRQYPEQQTLVITGDQPCLA
ncbi:hypothetical protein JK151_08910 [Ralstonia syzygii subsp. celebesensis]|uniref:Uncharacterized protein n=2 Tax=Ralstonia syzygii subsp. celebesensis TaxID=1310168 RepID=A0A1U9VMW2_9RALS|nr:hypothetical protein B0B51_03210 [blood disease bacterium A2-HR MARDI]QQV57012.1 hypothetical protein JK151_08910 [Ralstonia syzygii subsp. celebesensis]